MEVSIEDRGDQVAVNMVLDKADWNALIARALIPRAQAHVNPAGAGAGLNLTPKGVVPNAPTPNGVMANANPNAEHSGECPIGANAISANAQDAKVLISGETMAVRIGDACGRTESVVCDVDDMKRPADATDYVAVWNAWAEKSMAKRGIVGIDETTRREVKRFAKFVFKLGNKRDIDEKWIGERWRQRRENRKAAA